ncbi:fungal-specific transcription factor domain-containing protein [Fennellomyces sp. T-0311]|nr:fungal-specific transcription factor domain-containing protein [Fennellomyces sp. T-0311]
MESARRSNAPTPYKNANDLHALRQTPSPFPSAPVIPSSQLSDTTDNTPPRRTRITRACDTCRRKKIKCDVNTTQPCTTCRQYNWECSFNDAAKKRGPPKGYIESLETRLKKMEQLLQQMQDKKRKRSDDSSPFAIKNILSDEPGVDPKRARTTDHTKSLADDLIHKYFEISHDTAPVLDKEEFLAAYQPIHNAPSIPFSLIYAVCAYTSYRLPYNDPIFSRNNVSRDTMFRDFTEKAVDLIKEDYFISRLATIQAIVLICAQPTKVVNQNRNWVFSGLAVRMAQEFRLHRLANPPTTDTKRLDLYKRIWCSVYIADRWQAATMGRPLAIADSDCDIELPNSNHAIFGHLAKLSCILGDILRTVYSPQARQYLQSSATASGILITRLESNLEQWVGQIPEPEKKRPLMLCYYGISLMLYRPFIAASPSLGVSEKCTEIARKLVDLGSAIPKLDLVRFGFIFTGYSIYQSVLIHLYDMTRDCSEVASSAHEYARKSIDECLMPLCNELADAPEMKMLMISTVNLLKSESSPNADSEESQKWKRLLGSAGPPFADLGVEGELKWTGWNYPNAMLLQK